MKVWDFCKDKIGKLYTLVNAYCNGSIKKMIAIFVIYAIVMSFSLIILPTWIMVGKYGLNAFTETIYPALSFFVVVAIWVLFILIGNRTIK